VCSSSCQLSTEGCGGVSGGSCGDGFINIGEECDGDLFGVVDECSDFDSVSFTSGDLSCSSCRISTFGCEGVVGGGSCGDGVVAVGEQCDGSDLNGVGCGNGVLDVGETCDGLFFVGGSNRCVDYSGEFISGFLVCWMVVVLVMILFRVRLLVS